MKVIVQAESLNRRIDASIISRYQLVFKHMYIERVIKAVKQTHPDLEILTGNLQKPGKTVECTLHPGLDILVGYLHEPELSEYSDVRNHLRRCSHCRKNVTGLERLMQKLKSSIRTDVQPVGAGHLVDRQIEQYVKGQLSSERAEYVKSHIRECGECMKSVLHYRARVAATESHRKESVSGASNPVKNILDRMRVNCRARTKGIASTPIAACILAAMSIPVSGMLLLAGNDPNLAAAVYGQNSYLTVVNEDNSIPGIGFFSIATQEETRIPYKGLEVNVDRRNQIALAWAPIPDVERYTLKLFTVDDGQRDVVANQELTDTRYIVDNHQVLKNIRYEWELVGHGHHVSYHTRGGFVIDELPH